MLRSLFFTALLLLLASCTTPEETPYPPAPAAPTETSAAPDTTGTHEYGQTIYVPAYSHIYYQNHRRVINLTTTLSVRNTDIDSPLQVTAVRYYGSEGNFIRRYIEQPLLLGPMASEAFVVEVDDTSGGFGANFIVEWRSDHPVTQPVVEAVMISTASNQGISFLTTGRVIEDLSRQGRE